MRKIGIQIEDDIYNKLDKISLLTRKTKTHYINNALRESLEKILNEDEKLKEKVEFLLMED